MKCEDGKYACCGPDRTVIGELVGVTIDDAPTHLRLNAQLICLPEDGTGIPHYGLRHQSDRPLSIDRRVRRGKKKRHRNLSKLLETNRARSQPAVLEIPLPARLSVNCPDCGRRLEIDTTDSR